MHWPCRCMRVMSHTCFYRFARRSCILVMEREILFTTHTLSSLEQSLQAFSFQFSKNNGLIRINDLCSAPGYLAQTCHHVILRNHEVFYWQMQKLDGIVIHRWSDCVNVLNILSLKLSSNKDEVNMGLLYFFSCCGPIWEKGHVIMRTFTESPNATNSALRLAASQTDNARRFVAVLNRGLGV